MKFYSHPQLSNFMLCPYLENRQFRQRYFFASHLSGKELEDLLSQGWRKFGLYFFIPECQNCQACLPIRIPVKKLEYSKSQRRLLAKNNPKIVVEVKDLQYSPEIYQIYKEHSLFKFQKQANTDDFHTSFYQNSCPALQSEYRIDGELVAVGFLDKSTKGLSSVYFIYKEKVSKWRLGIYSILKECEITKSLGLSYYYLGYYIKENPSLNYKGDFYPHQRLNWQKKKWEDFQKEKKSQK